MLLENKVTAVKNFITNNWRVIMISLNNRNKTILLLALVLFVILPFDFTWNHSALEHMAFEHDAFTSVLFYVFYFSVIITAASAVYNRYDIAKLSSLVCLIFIVILVIQTVSIQYLDRIFHLMGSGFIYVAVSVGLVLLSRKKEVK